MGFICFLCCVTICRRPFLSRGVGVGAGTDAGAEAGTDVGGEACVAADSESDVEAGAEVDGEVAGTEAGTERAEAATGAGAGAEADNKAGETDCFGNAIPFRIYPLQQEKSVSSLRRGYGVRVSRGKNSQLSL